MNQIDRKWNKSLIVTILALAWPTMLEEIMHTAVQYIDTAMVGSLGTYATAAVGATTTINWLVHGSIAALSVGFLARISQAHGAGDQEEARRTAAQAVTLTVFVGVILTALIFCISSYVPIWMQVDPGIRDLAGQYFRILYLPMLPRTASIIFATVLRAAGDTRKPMIVGIAVNLINVILNTLLIYPTQTYQLLGVSVTLPGADMGVLGAAAASAIAFAVGGIWMSIALFRHKIISPKGYSFAPDVRILKPCMKIALPNMLQRFGTSFGYVAFATMINSMGEVSAAAHTVANTVESAFYIPGYGMQTAAATLAGNAYGAKDRKRLKDLVALFIPIEMGLMLLSGGALFFLAEPLVRIFSKSEDVIRLGTVVLRMVAVSEPFYGFPIIMEGVLQGIGNTRQPFVFNITGMWGVRIVFTFICTYLLHLGLVAAWACMIAHNLLLFGLYLGYYLSKKWNPLEKCINIPPV